MIYSGRRRLSWCLILACGLIASSLSACNKNDSEGEPAPSEAHAISEEIPCDDLVTQSQIDDYLATQAPDTVGDILGENLVKCPSSSSLNGYRAIVVIPKVSPIQGKTFSGPNSTRFVDIYLMEESVLSMHDLLRIKSVITGRANSSVIVRKGQLEYVGVFLNDLPMMVVDRESASGQDYFTGLPPKLPSNQWLLKFWGPSILRDRTDGPSPLKMTFVFKDHKRPGKFTLVPIQMKDKKALPRFAEGNSISARDLAEMDWQRLKSLGDHAFAYDFPPLRPFLDFVTQNWQDIGISASEAKQKWKEAFSYAERQWIPMPISIGSAMESKYEDIDKDAIRTLRFLNLLDPNSSTKKFHDFLVRIEPYYPSGSNVMFDELVKAVLSEPLTPDQEKIVFSNADKLKRAGLDMDWGQVFRGASTLKFDPGLISVWTDFAIWRTESHILIGDEETLGLVLSGQIDRENLDQLITTSGWIKKFEPSLEAAQLAFDWIIKRKNERINVRQIRFVSEKATSLGLDQSALPWAFNQVYGKHHDESCMDFILQVAEWIKGSICISTSITIGEDRCVSILLAEKFVTEGRLTRENFSASQNDFAEYRNLFLENEAKDTPAETQGRYREYLERKMEERTPISPPESCK